MKNSSLKHQIELSVDILNSVMSIDLYTRKSRPKLSLCGSLSCVCVSEQHEC